MATRKRSGISFDRAFRIRTRFEERIADIYGAAIAFMLPHERVSERMREQVWGHSDVQRAPEWVKAYLEGYAKARWGALYRYHVVWMLSLDGSLVTSEEIQTIAANEKALGLDKSPDYRTPWMRVDTEASRHCWRDAKGNPRTDKPFDERFLAPPTSEAKGA